MRVQKVQVGADDIAMISCPTCKTVRTVGVGSYKDCSSELSVKCVCKQKFSIKLEFRQQFRKHTNIDGYFVKSEAGVDFKNSGRNGGASVNCMIKNLSREGVGFIKTGKQQLKEGSNIWLQFCLDDSRKTEITREVMVKSLQDDFVGCEFVPRACGVEPALGFFLMKQ